MSENKSTNTAFVLPSAITTATRTYVDSAIRRDVSAAKSDEAYLATLVAEYPEDLTGKVKSALSGAVAAYVAGRKVGDVAAAPAVKSRASKMVARAWYTVGMTRNGVDVAALPTVTLPNGTARDALSVVVNGEGGADLKPLRNAVTEAAKDGKWDTIPGILADAPKPEPKSPATDKDAAKDENGADAPVAVGADLSARNLGNLFRTLAEAVRTSALEYNEVDNGFMLEGLAEVEAAIHSRTIVPAVA